MKPPLACDLECTSLSGQKGSLLSVALSDGRSTVAWWIDQPSDLNAAREILGVSGGYPDERAYDDAPAADLSDAWVYEPAVHREAADAPGGTPQGAGGAEWAVPQLSLGQGQGPQAGTAGTPGGEGEAAGNDRQVQDEAPAATETRLIVHHAPMEGLWSVDFFGHPLEGLHERFIDTALLAYRVDPGQPTKLSSVAARHLPEFSGWKTETASALVDAPSMLELPRDEVLRRNAVDAFVTRRLYDILWAKLSPEERAVHSEDVAISLFTARMSRRGMLVDAERLVALRKKCLATMAAEEAWLRNETGVSDLNPGSTQQLADVFEKRAVPLPKSAGGAPSTNGMALRVLRHDTSDDNLKRLIDSILRYRKAQDVLGDNVTAYALARDWHGRVHGGYWPGTVSFRPAAPTQGREDQINTLNVPREGVRQLFTAPPGYVFFEMDLSQAELRIMAQLSKDPVLLDGFRNNTDFHRRTGSRVYDVPEEQVTKNQRYVGKKGNFSCGYFIGEEALWEAFAREDIILPFAVVQKLRKVYWQEFAGLGRYADKERAKVRRGEPLFAPTGAYRWTLEQSLLLHPGKMEEAINSVYNWTIQSVPPRLVYRMALLIERRVPEAVARCVNSVYDCLCYEVREDSVVEFALEMERARTEVMAAESWLTDVEIPCDMKAGPSWGELKPVELRKA